MRCQRCLKRGGAREGAAGYRWVWEALGLPAGGRGAAPPASGTRQGVAVRKPPAYLSGGRPRVRLEGDLELVLEGDLE
jgi:hypothetical protein